MNSIFSRARDAALEKALLLWAQPKIERYGEVKHLRLDTANKRLKAEVALKGDPPPLTTAEARYRLEQRGQDTFFILYEMKVSKQWAQNLVDDHCRELPLKVPEVVRRFIG